MTRSLILLACLAALVTRGARAADLPVFRIGVLNDQSGLYADIAGPGSVEATRMAVEDFKPESHGFRVEILAGDHLNKPDVGAGIVRRWFDSDGVDVIADVPTSSVALAVSSIARERNKVFLIDSAGASDLTGTACSPNTVHWTYDTWALANSSARAMLRQGGKTWFFITADYTFGQSLERDATQIITAQGGQVVGHAMAPFQTTDFSSYLLQAQASGAAVVALANSGGDTINAIKQAGEFGLRNSGQKLVALLAFISDIHSVGLQTAQGLLLTSAFYWDKDDGTRAFSKRFAAKNSGRMPTMNQAGAYASALHWMKAVASVDPASPRARDGAAVVAAMKAIPTEDALFGRGSVRADGRVLHDLYLYQVKAPGESRGPYDYYKLVDTIPGAQAFRPLGQGGCPLVAN